MTGQSTVRTCARGGTATDSTTDQPLPTIEFAVPMPGFPEHRRFMLVRATEGPVYTLRSLDDPDVRFLVVPPAPFFPEYAPQVGAEVIEQLATTDPADLLVLLVVTVPADGPAAATANLLAPVIVDQSSRRAAQVVQAEDFPVRAPLLPA